MSDPNKKRLNECKKYLSASFVSPDDKSIKENNFDLILESVGLGDYSSAGNKINCSRWDYNTYWINPTDRRL